MKKKKPKFKDDCNHLPETEFIGTFQHWDAFESKTLDYDVYVWQRDRKIWKNGCHQAICIRFGNSGSEYHSITDIIQLARFAQLKPISIFSDALTLILKVGTLTYATSPIRIPS